VWDGDELVLDAALGHAQDPSQPLLRTRLAAAAPDDGAATALGVRAAQQLRQADRAGYLAAA
jgi:hydroxymethylbilane synthase